MMKAESSKHFLISPTSRKIQTEKNDIKDFDFVYYPRYSVSGTISGKIKPHGLNIMFKSGSPFYGTALSAVDENGRYKADGLIYGQEYDAFISSDFLPFGILGDNSIIVSDNNVKNIEVIPVFYGVGTVFDSNTKQGLKDITVKAVSSDGLHEQSTDTSADGSFILNGLYYGENYIIKIDAQPDFEPPVEIKTGIVKSTVTGLNFPLIPNK